MDCTSRYPDHCRCGDRPGLRLSLIPYRSKVQTPYCGNECWGAFYDPMDVPPPYSTTYHDHYGDPQIARYRHCQQTTPQAMHHLPPTSYSTWSPNNNHTILQGGVSKFKTTGYSMAAGEATAVHSRDAETRRRHCMSVTPTCPDVAAKGRSSGAMMPPPQSYATYPSTTSYNSCCHQACDPTRPPGLEVFTDSNRDLQIYKPQGPPRKYYDFYHEVRMGRPPQTLRNTIGVGQFQTCKVLPIPREFTDY